MKYPKVVNNLDTIPENDEYHNLDIVFEDNSNYTTFGNKRGVITQLKDMLQHLDIYNEIKFQYCLKRNPDLARLIVRCPSNQVEHAKKQMYQVVRETRKYTGYRERMNNIATPNLYANPELCVAMSTMMEILESIAKENYCTIDKLCDDIFRILCMDLHKINAIIFVGSTNSGKSFLADILLCVYQEYEMGKFALPPTRNPPQFWLESILGGEIYRCEELAVQDQENLQHVKKLLEGNPALEATVKFKNPVTVVRRPVFVTMNGDGEQTITRGQSSERGVIATRSFIYKMHHNITKRHCGNHLLLYKYRFQVMKLLFNKYGDYKEPPPLENEIDMAMDICKKYF